MMYGIDISRHQGEADWDQIEAQYNAGKIGFVIARAGYGYATVDSQWKRNYWEATKRKIPLGAYWYAYWGKGTPVQEAEAFLSVVDGCVLPCGIWYDVEYERSITGLDKTERTTCALEALNVLARSGRYVGLYASTDMINNRMEYERLKTYDIWCAQYAEKCTCKMPVGIWQYSSKNPLGVPGFGAHLDCNKAYKDYPAIVKGTLSGAPAVVMPEEEKTPPTPVVTLAVGPASRGDLVELLRVAYDLQLDAQGTLNIGPLTPGDAEAIKRAAADMQLGVEVL